MYTVNNYSNVGAYRYVSPYQKTTSTNSNNQITPIKPADPVSKWQGSSMSATTNKFLSEYSSQMQSLSSSAKELTSSSSTNAWGKLSASSGDEKVATAQVNFAPKEPAEYKVNVQQLAAAQVNSSKELASTEASELGKGSFVIEQGGKATSINYDATGKTNKDALKDLARSVNAAGIGVVANVVEKDGKSTLQLSSTETGAQNGFKVVGDDFAAKTGADQASTQAQNAVYTVENTKSGEGSKQMTSSSNKVAIDSYRVSATLTGTGETTIKLGPSAENITKSVKNLVGEYNDTVKLLSSNAEAMGPGVSNNLYKLLSPPTSEASLKTIGITYDKKGQLQLDEAKLTQAIEKDPKNVELITNNMARGIASDATSALSEPSRNLVPAKTNSVADPTDPMSYYKTDKDFYSMMYTFSKRGIYTGDYIGSFLNSKA